MRATTIILAIASPGILVTLSALTKRLVGGAWQRACFFLGVELCVAAIATTTDHLLDVFRRGIISGNWGSRDIGVDALLSALGILFSFFGYLVVVTMHQSWEKDEKRPKAQAFQLMFLANLIGAGLLIGFALLVAKVKS
jgi:hypothetical protein